MLHRDGFRCRCEYCRAASRLLVAHEVDHIVSRDKAKALGWSEEKTEDVSNLQAINRDCHKRKTREEKGSTLRVPRLIGADGFPV